MTIHLLFGALVVILLAATYTDLRERLIYDRFVLSGLVFALGVHLYHNDLPWSEYLLTGVGAFLFLAVVAVLTKGSAIGGGDIKLFAMIGFMLGLQWFLWIFILSHVLAGLFIMGAKLFFPKKFTFKTEFPFAPFILSGTIGTYFLI
ncbi:prepilin peptidase [Salinithrix halophila]|uniref:Prepilin peptidase n=1 Tax=Salinithrix halophila TaxID=1485204 RepID=A0ABV8JAA3_9BACL